MSTNPTLKNQIFLLGIASSTAVSLQTISLVWANNVLKKQKKYGTNLFQSAIQVYKKGGLKSFFKGSFTPFIYNIVARFGDITSNYLVLNFFKNHSNLNQIPLFLQTFVSWGLASTWRLAITPLTIIANPQTFHKFNQISPHYRLARTYKKFIKPQILSLYSWFLVQNYLISLTNPIKFSQSPYLAFIRFSIFGFLSMITYDCYLKLKYSVWPPSLPSKYWVNKVIMKGMFGVVFCTCTQFMKERLEIQKINQQQGIN